MPDSVITSSFIVRACATTLRMFFERPDELIATRAVAGAGAQPYRMRDPILEPVVVGEARHHACIAEAECGHRRVFRQIDRQMRRAMPAEPPLPMKMTRPPCSRVRNQSRARGGECLAKTASSTAGRAMQAPHVIGEESLVIGINRTFS